MEKISHILRGNARISGPEPRVNARPGSPGSAKAQPEPEEKPQTRESIVQKSADSFFMSRPRATSADKALEPPAMAHEEERLAQEAAHDGLEEVEAPHDEEVQMAQPSGFVPRGSFVNVHA